MNFVRLPVLMIIGLSMILGAYIPPRTRGGWQLTLTEPEAESVVGQTPNGATLESWVPPAESSQSATRAPSPRSFAAEEEHEDDELLFAGLELILLSHDSERTSQVQPVLSSHIIDLSRRPPRQLSA